MRILYIVTAFPRRPGDVITPWLSETIRRLKARGIEVEVLAPSYRGLADHEIDGIKVHRFRYAPALIEKLTHDQTAPDRVRERPWYLVLVPGYVAAGCLATARLARSDRFDVLHVFWPLPHGLFALFAKRHTGIPFIATFFGVELTWVRRQLTGLGPVIRRIVKGADAVTAISSHTARELRRIAPNTRVRAIPFGAAIPDSPRGLSHPRTTANGPDDVFRLLFVGRLVERKGVSFLLRALARVREKRDVRLTVAGDGPLLPALRQEAASLNLSTAVDFTGFISGDDLARLYQDCDAFVLPAVEDSKGDVEGLGVVLLEAMVHDRPVIASNSGGIPDIVIDGTTGLLTEPADVDSLVSAIERVASDPVLRASLVNAARDHVATNFSWQGIIDHLEELYAEVAATVPEVRPSTGV